MITVISWGLFLLSCSTGFAAPKKPKLEADCQAILNSKWTYREDSATGQFRIFYKNKKDKPAVQRLLKDLEDSAQFAQQLGFRMPVSMQAEDPNRLSIFIKKHSGSFVIPLKNPRHENKIRSQAVFMTFDKDDFVSVPYSRTLAAHEFHHAVQAAYTWNYPTSIHEMSSNYFQEKLNPGHGVETLIEIEDFQKFPELPILLDDEHETKFMYGAWIYLEFLEGEYFQGSPKFLQSLWDEMAKQEAAGKTNLEDAITAILPNGVTYEDSLVRFARWRALPHEDFSARYLQGQPLPQPKLYDWLDTVKKKSFGGQMLQAGGTHYIEVEKPEGCGALKIHLDGQEGVRWAVQEIQMGSQKSWVSVQALGQDIAGPLDYGLSVECSGML